MKVVDKRGCSDGKHSPPPTLRLWVQVIKGAKMVGTPRDAKKKEGASSIASEAIQHVTMI